MVDPNNPNHSTQPMTQNIMRVDSQAKSLKNDKKKINTKYDMKIQ
jgi:hypothetical protein